MSVEVEDLPPPEYQPVTWPQIREMAAHGIEIGSHTCSHPRLSLATREEVEYELSQSKHRLETELGREVMSFCYPHGQREDLTLEVRDAVARAGYQDAVVAFCDAQVLGDLFALRRHGVGKDMDHFRGIISGVELLSAKLSSGRGIQAGTYGS
jgi:peptidoglycan/xylan/chitin deacetylase (PgdA/CDA1 family)